MAKRSLLRRYFFVFAYLLIFVFSTGHVYGQESATPLIISIRYERGVRLYKEREYERAIQEFQRILELKPEHKQAKKYLTVSKKKKAEKVIHELYGEAETYYKQKEYQKAIDTYQKVLEIIQDDGYSLYTIEVLKARIEKIERGKREHRTQALNRLDRQMAKKESLEPRELVQKETEQQATEIKKHVDEAIAGKYQEQEKSLVVEMALREAEEAVVQKDKRISELIVSIPQETMDEGFSLLQGLSAKEKMKRTRLTYGVAKDYYKKKDYVRAVEAFRQVIVLEENVVRKRYTIHAQRYINCANDQLDKEIEKELSGEDATYGT